MTAISARAGRTFRGVEESSGHVLHRSGSAGRPPRPGPRVDRPRGDGPVRLRADRRDPVLRPLPAQALARRVPHPAPGRGPEPLARDGGPEAWGGYQRPGALPPDPGGDPTPRLDRPRGAPERRIRLGPGGAGRALPLDPAGLPGGRGAGGRGGGLGPSTGGPACLRGPILRALVRRDRLVRLRAEPLGPVAEQGRGRAARRLDGRAGLHNPLPGRVLAGRGRGGPHAPGPVERGPGPSPG